MPDRVSTIIFTDLDGTLLDGDYSWRGAEPAFDFCRAKRIPVVMVSSKTRLEMEYFHQSLHLDAPFVSENGGAIFIKDHFILPGGLAEAFIGGDGGYKAYPLSPAYPYVSEALKAIAGEMNCAIRGFSAMSPEEISRIAGLSYNQARLAASREFDEPFIVETPDRFDEEQFRLLARNRGLDWSKGGLFHHLHGFGGKGKAVQLLLDWYAQDGPIRSIGLGDAPNDYDMLHKTDFPILFGSSSHDPSRFPDGFRPLIVGDGGPEAWNREVLSRLKQLEAIGK